MPRLRGSCRSSARLCDTSMTDAWAARPNRLYRAADAMHAVRAGPKRKSIDDHHLDLLWSIIVVELKLQ
jgi:hypothetical protein